MEGSMANGVLKLRLIIDVEYLQGNTSERYLREQLGALAESAFDRGGLTGVKTWEYEVQKTD